MLVSCIKCGHCEAGNLTVDLDDGVTLNCGNCEESYTVGDVEAVMNEWAVILPWLKAHPSQKGQG